MFEARRGWREPMILLRRRLLADITIHLGIDSLTALLSALALTACGSVEVVGPAASGSGGAVSAGGHETNVSSSGSGAGGIGGGGALGENADGDGGVASLPTSIHCSTSRCQPPNEQCCLLSDQDFTKTCIDSQETCPTTHFSRCADSSACPGGVCCAGLGPSRGETVCMSFADCMAASGRIECTSSFDCQVLGSNCCGSPQFSGICLSAPFEDCPPP
jgi:hypothetical protein